MTCQTGARQPEAQQAQDPACQGDWVQHKVGALKICLEENG